MGKEPLPKIKTITVTEGERTMDVLIPQTNDKEYNDYLEVAEKEKTADELRKQPPKEKSKLSKSEKVEAIKEINEKRKRKKYGSGNPKYYSVGIDLKK